MTCSLLERSNIVIDAIADRRVGLATQDIRAVDDRDRLFYQECLARLIGPDGTVHGPNEFVPCLEALGEISVLDLHMLGFVLDQLEADCHAVLGCNLSADNLSDASLSEKLLDQILARTDLAPRLILELSGSEALQELSFAAEIIDALRGLGCRIALDNFGAGFASPRLIQLVDFDIVKLDRAFIHANRRSPDGRDNLAHMVGFVSSLVPIVIAQGVETDAQAVLARSAGATHVQGNVVSMLMAGNVDSAANLRRLS